MILPVNNRFDRIKASVAMLGLTKTIKAIIKAVCLRLFSYDPQKDKRFDRRYKTDTHTTVPREDLGISDERARQTAVFYVSPPVKFVRHILGSLEIAYENFDFVDVGCGKGRILMLASDHPFRSITGIEISQELSMIAEKNLQVYRSPRQQCTNLQVRCMNASQFPIANENTVFYFYHPFHQDVLRPILENIASCFVEAKKKVFIVYIWMKLPTLFPLFDELGFTRLRHVQTLNVRYQYALYTLSQ